MDYDTEDFVTVAVPKRHYALVIRVLAEAEAAAQERGGGVNTPTKSGEGWSRLDIRQLKRLLKNPSARALMDLTCREPRNRISFSELCEHAGRSKAQARSDLQNFTKLIKREFNNPRGHWPVYVNPPSDDAGITYEASPEVAAAWNE